MEKVSVLEFYSGIGGTHYALKEAGINAEVSGAFEINTVANAVYKHNFPDTPLMQKNIEGLTVKDLDKMNADIWTMSPPCQPYTRQGKQESSNDPRSKSFLNIMQILSTMENPPSCIFMENVKGFESSDTRDMFTTVLRSREYVFQEFLVSPNDFGIPNSRLRYYLLAKLNKSFSFICSNSPIRYSKEDCQCDHDNCVCRYLKIKLNSCKPKSIQDLLDKQADASDFLLKRDILLRFYPILDIVNMESSHSCCFTKAYGKYIEGTGSVLTTAPEQKVNEIFENVEKLVDLDEKYKLLSSLDIRYFTPKEVAQLMCFPSNFCFPKETTVKQKFRLLGNSVNVFVVANLIRWFLVQE